MTQIRDLLKLPDRVRKGDFVLVLNEGIRRADETVETYAVTPALVQAFDTALSIIGSGLRDRRSQASYLHGSFGSGKSHFMAVLDLMLEGHPAPWKRPELHPLRDRFGWIGDANLLRLPMHMIGAKSTEQQVFQTYLEFVRDNHSDAPIPPLFADEALFADARNLRQTLGDTAFFDSLNATQPVADEGWGSLGTASQWDAARFERTLASSDLAERGELFSVLVKSHFGAYTHQRSGYVDLDRGLDVVARHASDLGYDGVVLFLDELILWLAGHLADRGFVQEEAQKLAKLREAQHSQRQVPIVSFIARQRDLAELVGSDAIGSELASLRDSLAWSSGRFETIVLEDRNLPAIVERRVLRPRGDDEAEALKDGFAAMRKRLGTSWEALLGSFALEEDFQKVYPFSPALVETLVALSNCLQRERTAIRILMELLVEHLPDLEIGDVVPLGDVFDVIAGGEDAFDHVMRDRFDRARHIYAHQLMPLIQAANDTTTRQRCQRLRDEHPVRLGCSGCSEAACRNDNRMAKTLLLAALVPEAGPFKGLTVKRLVDLNHGIVRAPIPGTEVAMAAGKLRNWATQVGQLRIGDQTDPEVSLRLEGVDLTPILASAQAADTPGSRKKLLKQLLFDQMQLPADGGTVADKALSWRGTKRPGKVRFGNIRELADDALRCPHDAQWYLVVDYPFDDPGHTPEEDLIRLSTFRDEQTATVNPTFAWLPSFFSERLQRQLGELAVLDEILAGDNPRRYLNHLRTEDQARARQDLESLRNQKRAQIGRALGQAYGIQQVTDAGALDPSRSVEKHLYSLQPGLPERPMLASGMEDATHQLAVRLLEHRYPHHPRFGTNVTPRKMDKAWGFVERLVDAPDQRVPVSRDEHAELRNLAEPLGLVQLAEAAATLNASRLREMEQQRERAGITTPTVEQTRRFADPEGARGLVREASDLMVLSYSLWSGRSLQRGGKLIEPDRLGRLADDIELVLAELPSETDWAQALDRAGELFGIALPGKARTARNLTALALKLEDALRQGARARELPAALRDRLGRWGTVVPVPARLETASCGSELLDALDGRRPVEQVNALAALVPRTSPTALGRSFKTAEPVLRTLRQVGVWVAMESVSGLVGDATRGVRAQQLLDDLRTALEDDQLNTPLEGKLDELARRAEELIRKPKEPTKETPIGWRERSRETVSISSGQSRDEVVDRLAADVRQKLVEIGEADEARVEIIISSKEGAK